jgi:hypothetical protein
MALGGVITLFDRRYRFVPLAAGQPAVAQGEGARP